jgi:hypothetical protein
VPLRNALSQVNCTAAQRVTLVTKGGNAPMLNTVVLFAAVSATCGCRSAEGRSRSAIIFLCAAATRRTALPEEVVARSRWRATGFVQVGAVGEPAAATGSAGAAGATESPKCRAAGSDRVGNEKVPRGAALADASRSRLSDRVGLRADASRELNGFSVASRSRVIPVLLRCGIGVVRRASPYGRLRT